jgi:hypothetical protein
MKDNFLKAKRILGTNTSTTNVVAVNGCCYGKNGQPDKGSYLKLCGQDFWEFISANENLYTEIVEPIGYRARENNQEFELEYAKVINRFTFEFMQSFCTNDGAINWPKIIQINSASNNKDK